MCKARRGCVLARCSLEYVNVYDLLLSGSLDAARNARRRSKLRRCRLPTDLGGLRDAPGRYRVWRGTTRYAFHEPYTQGTSCSACHNADAFSTDCATCHDLPADYTWYDEDNYAGPHGDYQTTSSKCDSCHSVHNAPAGSTMLLPGATVVSTCETCHDGTGGYGVYGAILAVTGVAPSSGHGIETTNVVPGGDAATGGAPR